MSGANTMRIAVVDTGQLADIVRGRSEGGSRLEEGLASAIARSHPEIQVEVSVLPKQGSFELRGQIESGESDVVGASYDVLVMSVAGEVARVRGRGVTARESIDLIADDLATVIEACKADNIRVLVANISTLDPDHQVYTMHGLDEEPFQVLAQRLNLMTTTISQQYGISVIDVDRIIAEAGGDETVFGRLDYNEQGCLLIRDEILRIIEDYGFLDDRPLMDQVGAGPGRS